VNAKRTRTVRRGVCRGDVPLYVFIVAIFLGLYGNAILHHLRFYGTTAYWLVGGLCALFAFASLAVFLAAATSRETRRAQ
jgi:hypothetical protein